MTSFRNLPLTKSCWSIVSSLKWPSVYNVLAIDTIRITILFLSKRYLFRRTQIFPHLFIRYRKSHLLMRANSLQVKSKLNEKIPFTLSQFPSIRCHFSLFHVCMHVRSNSFFFFLSHHEIFGKYAKVLMISFLFHLFLACFGVILFSVDALGCFHTYFRAVEVKCVNAFKWIRCFSH